MALAERISRERTRRGWSKADLARKARIDPSYVTRIEAAQFNHPSIDKVRAIAEALRIDLSALTDPPPTETPDDQALLRKLIERRVGDRASAELVQMLLDRIHGRPPADQQTVIRLVDALIDALPDRPAH
jgi:transcriptional regulator with XRE-family HTH domain